MKSCRTRSYRRRSKLCLQITTLRSTRRFGGWDKPTLSEVSEVTLRCRWVSSIPITVWLISSLLTRVYYLLYKIHTSFMQFFNYRTCWLSKGLGRGVYYLRTLRCGWGVFAALKVEWWLLLYLQYFITFPVPADMLSVVLHPDPPSPSPPPHPIPTTNTKRCNEICALGCNQMSATSLKGKNKSFANLNVKVCSCSVILVLGGLCRWHDDGMSVWNGSLAVFLSSFF